MRFWHIFILVLFFSPIVAQNKVLEDYKAQAEELAQKYVIVDGHVDLPYRLRIQNFRLTKEYLGIPIETSKGDFDYVRSKKGGLSAPFMSIYIPASYQIEGGAKRLADSLINMVSGIITAHPDKFAFGNSPDEILENYNSGKISLPMGMENGVPIQELSDVAYFHKRGIRYITLTHSKDNAICDSSYDTTSTWNGLSHFGKQVIQEMNAQGIMIDISHVSDAAFYQTIGLTQAPIIASHSSCRKFTPGFQRNMNDNMIKSLAKNGGVIMINFGTYFLNGALAKNWDEMRSKLKKLLEEKNLDSSDETAKPIIKKFQAEFEKPLFADVKIVADHIDHVVKLVGIEHVGLGSDYDGVGDSLPTGLKDVSTYPNLIAELLRRGYIENDIEKICSGNIFRVWRQVESIAKVIQSEME